MRIQVQNVDAPAPDGGGVSRSARQNENPPSVASTGREEGVRGSDLPDEKQIRAALEKVEKMAGIFDRNLKFLFRKEADVYQVEVIDASRDEVVRKIPPDEMIRFIGRINEMIGALFDVSA